MNKILSIEEVDEKLNDNKCEKCYYKCNAKLFQRNFRNWTSGNSEIDKLIQDTQLLAHKDSEISNVLEWIPYDRLYDIKYIKENKFGKVYRANWIDGHMQYWNKYKQDLVRSYQNIIVNLKSLNNLKNITFEFINEIKKDYKFYGLTQDPETHNYTIVFNDICKKCNEICSAIRFQQKFIDWTSSNNDIDKLIQDTQLSSHIDVEALEWIPYDRLYDFKYIEENKFGKVYRADWIDGFILYWNGETQNWKRNGHKFVKLISLSTQKTLTLEFINKIKLNHIVYGITQDPETKYYMIIVNNKCEVYNNARISKYFQQNFENWTSGNNDIDKLIQDTQLSFHNKDVKEALEWIPYDRLYNIKYIEENKSGKVYRANWIEHCFYSQKNVFVKLKSLSTPKILILEFINKIKLNYRLYGITQNPVTNNYIIVFDDICEICTVASESNARFENEDKYKYICIFSPV